MGNPRIFWFMAHIIQFCRMICICRRNMTTNSCVINKRTENTEGYRASYRERDRMRLGTRELCEGQ